MESDRKKRKPLYEAEKVTCRNYSNCEWEGTSILTHLRIKFCRLLYTEKEINNFKLVTRQLFDKNRKYDSKVQISKSRGRKYQNII